jgi:hypothetical protein
MSEVCIAFMKRDFEIRSVTVSRLTDAHNYSERTSDDQSSMQNDGSWNHEAKEPSRYEFSRCSLEVGPVTLITMGVCEIRNFVPKRTLLLARCCQHGLTGGRSGTDFHDALTA